MHFELISIAALSREIECSERAIRKAIKEGYITKAVQRNEKGRLIGLDKGMAAWEWLQSFAGRTANKKHIPERLQDIVDQFGEPETDGKTKTTLQEKPESSNEPNTETEPNYVLTSSSELAEMDIAELKKMQEIAKTEEQMIRTAKLKGELIEVKKVDKSMYDFGMQVKGKVMSIPDRIADELFACESRSELHLKLYNALSDALRELADKHLES